MGSAEGRRKCCEGFFADGYQQGYYDKISGTRDRSHPDPPEGLSTGERVRWCIDHTSYKRNPVCLNCLYHASRLGGRRGSLFGLFKAGYEWGCADRLANRKPRPNAYADYRAEKDHGTPRPDPGERTTPHPWLSEPEDQRSIGYDWSFNKEGIGWGVQRTRS